MLAESTTDRPNRRFPRHRLDPTDRVLIDMLTENTGIQMMDSGGDGGRNWQRNQDRDFLAEPPATLCVCFGYKNLASIDVTLDVFHWLRERVTYDGPMTRKFNNFCNRKANREEYTLDNVHAFAQERAKFGDVISENTYNKDTLLSQVLQYSAFNDDETGRAYAVLQIHGGADVRGGYTNPKVFRIDDTYALCDAANATITELNAPDSGPELPGLKLDRPLAPWWCTDDGYHWYREGTCGLNSAPELQTYEVSFDPADRGKGKIYVDADGVAFGPLHGGELRVET